MKYVGLLFAMILLYGCASGEANKIPYKYRTAAQVERECIAMQKENAESNARASSNSGNFALGVMMALREDWACDPYK